MTLLISCLEGAPAALPPVVESAPPSRAQMVEAPGLRGYLVRPGTDGHVSAEVWAYLSIEEAARITALDAADHGQGVLVIGEDTDTDRALRYLAGLAWVEEVGLRCERPDCAEDAGPDKASGP